MIVSQKVSLTRALVSLRRPLLLLLLWSIAITVAHWYFPKWELWISPMPLTVAGVVIGTLLAFLNNAAYDRYWEARGLWGRLVNYSRSFVRQLVVYFHQGPASGELPADESPVLCREREEFIRANTHRIIGFAHALRHHLRGENSELELGRLIPAWELAQLKEVRNVPAGVLMLVGSQLSQARRLGWADIISISALDATLTELANIQGGCERIKNTPLPPAYTQIGHKVVLLYCALLPFGLVTEVQLLTPVVVTLIAFAVLTLSRITMLLEHPFGLRANDLPLTALCRTIEIDLRQALSEVDVPPPVEAVDGILL